MMKAKKLSTCFLIRVMSVEINFVIAFDDMIVLQTYPDRIAIPI